MSRAVIGACVPVISLAEPLPEPPTATLPPEEPMSGSVPERPPTPVPPPSEPAPAVSASSGSVAARPSYGQSSPEAPFYQGPPRTPVPPPPGRPPEERRFPAFSARIDPLNWLLDGRLGLELEAELFPFMTVEVVPVFVVASKPIYLARTYDDEISQRSNGLGPLSGGSLGLGFWFAGKPLRGNVLRVILTNQSMTYRANARLGGRDEVSHTERRLYAYFGSHRIFGDVFTLAAGFGIGLNLNRQERCFDADGDVLTECEDDELLIRDSYGREWDLDSFTYPVELLGRISLGVTIF